MSVYTKRRVAFHTLQIFLKAIFKLTPQQSGFFKLKVEVTIINKWIISDSSVGVCNPTCLVLVVFWLSHALILAHKKAIPGKKMVLVLHNASYHRKKEKDVPFSRVFNQHVKIQNLQNFLVKRQKLFKNWFYPDLSSCSGLCINEHSLNVHRRFSERSFVQRYEQLLRSG